MRSREVAVPRFWRGEQMFSRLCYLEQGRQFTGWSISARIEAPLFRFGGSAITPRTITSGLLIVSIAYMVYTSFYRRFRAVLTDNGPAYRSRAFAQACRTLGLKHRFTRPYTPRTNGKAERFIQTALREWAYARSYQNSNERSQELRPWLHQYNWHRPHASLGLSPPISRSDLDRNNLLRLHS